MKLSVVIVSYNEKKYLPQAIESCLNQDFSEDFEIIIGDDGSSDGSIELIKEYSEKYPEKIKYFVMDREPGIKPVPSFRVSNIFFRAFDMLKGEYIMCMSGDDYFCDMNKFSKQTKFLDEHKNYDSCYTGYKKVWDDGDEQVMPFVRHMSNAVFWSGDYAHISCFAFRKNCLQNLLPRFSDDTGLIFSILKTGKSYAFKDVMFAYRQREKSIMHEADMLELSILELMIMQDVIEVGGYRKSSLSRFSRPLAYVLLHQEELDNIKYDKYIQSGMAYPDGKLVGQAKRYGFVFKIIRKFNRVLSKFF